MSNIPSTNHYRGRIAPSPTGYLHLGHAKTFWTAFDRRNQAGGTLIYRNEDVDFQRCKDHFATAALEDLHQLGIQWDEGPYHQSQRTDLYVSNLEKLASLNLIYPSEVSRRQIREHPDTKLSETGEAVFPKALRAKGMVPRRPIDLEKTWRFKAPDSGHITFADKNLGPQSFECQIDFGDFVVWRKEGMPSYELAVVVDDIDMQITEVVRGADLLVSTARQLLIYEAMDVEPPNFFHESLVVDDSGERLAKRKDSLALRTLFAAGHTLETIKKLWNTYS